MPKAKLFSNGGSQAVRLPAEFRFDGDDVDVRRDPLTGDVILSLGDRTCWRRAKSRQRHYCVRRRPEADQDRKDRRSTTCLRQERHDHSCQLKFDQRRCGRPRPHAAIES